MKIDGYKLRRGVLVPDGYRTPARASFDSAQSGPQMAQRFAYANTTSPDTDNNSLTRTIIRNRARYEAQNSTYARGITLTVANDTIGTGPRLQFLSSSRSLNAQVETSFQNWAREIRLAEMLRTIRLARMIDGEVIIELVTNPELNHNVKMSLAIYEADFLTSKFGQSNTRTHYDGIDYDKYGNPIRYWLLDEHPNGSSLTTDSSTKPKAHDASSIIHYFRIDRPGQRRGVSELQAALELFNMLRTYTKSTLDAAETAANHAGLLYTQGAPESEPDDVNAFYEENLTRNMMKALPYGWDFRQLKAEQPTTTYGDFKNEIITEIARCLNVPFNVAALNSSDYNYASGRLDHQTYFRSLEIEQDVIEATILDRIYSVWLMEWSLTRGLTRMDQVKHRWYWDGRLHVDPLKEANAQAARLANGTSTLAEEYAAKGMDWETEMEQRALEQAKLEELGLKFEYNISEDQTDVEDDTEGE